MPEIGAGTIRYFATETAVFAQDTPNELLEAGEVLGLQDFHDAAARLGTRLGQGTRVFKEVISSVAPNDVPFSFAWRLNADDTGHGICTNFGYVGVHLRHFYVATHALVEHKAAVEAETRDLYRKHGVGGRLLLKEALLEIV